MKRIIGFLLILMLMVTPSSASVIDDMNLWIDDGIKSVLSSIKILSVTGITETIVCKPNDPFCGLSTKDTNTWQMTSNVMSSSTSVKLIVPSGTEMSLSDGSKIKTTSDISLTFVNGQPYQDVGLSNAGYKTYVKSGVWWNPLAVEVQYPQSYRTLSAASRIITSSYDVTLANQYGSKTVSNLFNYNSNKVITITDSSGKMATVTNQFQTYSGVSTEVGDVVIVGGYGDLRTYYRTEFEAKNKLYNDCATDISPIPVCKKIYGDFDVQNDYTSVLNYLENKFGLQRQYLSTVGFTVLDGTSGKIMRIKYPSQGIGTYVLAEFPKSMVSYIIIQNIGSKAGDVSLSKYPDHIGYGEGAITITVTARNDGTSDMMYASNSLTGGWVITSTSPSGQYVDVGKTGTWYFEARLANSLSSTVTDNICITVKGTLKSDSGITKCMSVIGDKTDVDPTTYKVWVKAYKPDMTNLATAIIKQNGNVIGYGSVETTLTNGKQYRFTSENTSGFFPPVVDITVKGQPSEIKLVFSSTPQGDDYTWIFWLFVIGIFVAILYVSGLWRYIPILLNPAIIIPLLYLIGFGIVIFLLWGLINAIANFKLF